MAGLGLGGASSRYSKISSRTPKRKKKGRAVAKVAKHFQRKRGTYTTSPALFPRSALCDILRRQSPTLDIADIITVPAAASSAHAHDPARALVSSCSPRPSPVARSDSAPLATLDLEQLFISSSSPRSRRPRRSPSLPPPLATTPHGPEPASSLLLASPPFTHRARTAGTSNRSSSCAARSRTRSRSRNGATRPARTPPPMTPLAASRCRRHTVRRSRGARGRGGGRGRARDVGRREGRGEGGGRVRGWARGGSASRAGEVESTTARRCIESTFAMKSARVENVRMKRARDVEPEARTR